MKSDFNKYKGKYVMRCKTEEEATEFCNVMHDSGRAWCNGDSYLFNTSWNGYEEKTAYDFNNGKYCRVQYFVEEGYTILEWNDFRKEKEMTKNELKTGMIVECRNDDKRMVLLDTPTGNALISDIGWMNLDNYRDNLCYRFDKQFDIVAVYEPCSKWQMASLSRDNQKCIWRRSKVTEVTLSEIAEKFEVAVEDIRIKEE